MIVLVIFVGWLLCLLVGWLVGWLAVGLSFVFSCFGLSAGSFCLFVYLFVCLEWKWDDMVEEHRP